MASLVAKAPLTSWIILPLSFLLYSMNDFVELTPRHEGIDGGVFALALATGLAGAVIGWRVAVKGRQARGTSRFKGASNLGFIGSVSVILVLVPGSELIESLTDFPPSGTKSAEVLIPITMAYATHYRNGGTHKIQTNRDWPDIQISSEDYAYMLAHQPPDFGETDKDLIPSDGYFCAHLTLQQAGNAVRVMKMDWGILRRGSVVVCPASNTDSGAAPL